MNQRNANCPFCHVDSSRIRHEVRGFVIERERMERAFAVYA
ncbi:MAG: hypothetical protein U5R46_02215 [Gammaproteobacteria bacterium]|nr:hypothetical protein [Gammaproteobacteria bacterium]